ncbi:sensor domain-containing protein [Amycolatopsis magusensis]|uniref:sensor histidine kinase n=1 Tax=Amycolatopsis magusensis TaxID=882444 RepID=UPI003C2F5420
MDNVWRRVVETLRYCLGTLGTGIIAAVMLPVMILTAALSLLGVGLLALPHELRWLARAADFERRRAGARLGRTVPGHERLGGQVRELLADSATVRDLRWLPVNLLAGLVLGTIGTGFILIPLLAVPTIALWWLFPEDDPMRVIANIPVTNWGSALGLGLVQLLLCLVLAVFVAPWIADLSARISALLLAPSTREKLTERVETLEETRAGAVDAHGAELRRIERDLHDGTQARLVSIAMRLGLAEQQLARDPQAVATLLAEAREGAEEAMTELRGVLRSMYPPILADRGLEGALAAVAANCPLPVELDVPTLGKLPAPVEAAAYFVVNEALTNVVKHSGATGAQVTVTRIGDTLSVIVLDNGRGGVSEERGTGVAGMRRRIAALDGQFMVDSPVGGPTVVAMDCPCGS